MHLNLPIFFTLLREPQRHNAVQKSIDQRIYWRTKMRHIIAASLLCVAAIGVVAIAPAAEAQNNAPGHTSRKAPDRAIQYPPVGHRVQALPRDHRTIRVNRQSYRYHNGSYYRPGRDGVYVVVYAPLGARVRSLPPGYISFGIGPRHYFYANLTYYLGIRNMRNMSLSKNRMALTRR